MLRAQEQVQMIGIFMVNYEEKDDGKGKEKPYPLPPEQD